MRPYGILLILFLGIGLTGCRERTDPQPVEPPPTPPIPNFTPIDPAAPEPLPILEKMVAAYQTANSYSDRATVQIIGKMTQPDTEPAPWNCIVAFQKPNKLRLEVYEGIFVSDGEDCYAQIKLLPDQVLHVPAPHIWTLETLFQDVHLDTAMELGLPLSVFRFPPQLVLLFANNPLNTFCPKGAKVEWIEQESIGQIPCDVIQIGHTDGNRILWISREDHALLRLDYQPVGLPVPEGFESIEAIRIEMTDARFDWDFVPETFQMLQPQDAVKVDEFHSDIPDLSTPEEHHRRLQLMAESDCYRLIDQHAESVAPTEEPSPKVEPRTFTLSPMWTVPLVGADTMALLPGETPKLLVPYKGNLIAVLNLQGKMLQEISPEGVGDSIITNIRVNDSPACKQRIGISTLDFKFYLFDESFESLVADNTEPNTELDEDIEESIRDFLFINHSEELLLLGIEQDSVSEDTVPNSIIRAVDLEGATRWEYPFEGVPIQITSAVLEDQLCVLVSRSAPQNSILVLSAEGAALEPVNIASGRHVIWLHAFGSTFYSLVENLDTGDIRIVGYDRNGKAQWSRLLLTGEYDLEPVFVSSEKKWFVPLPSGEIMVFDLQGNLTDTFSLNVVPTGLYCVEVGEETWLFVADGETLSAWKVGKRTSGSP
jgi:hypothetical protein